MFESIIDNRSKGETTLRKTQLVELYLLQILDEICKQNNLRYFLVGGTLIGAMRHNGFIPWDDDIDVGMLKPDFEKFLEIAGKHLPEGVVLQHPNDAYSTVTFAKLRDQKSFFGEPNTSVGAPHGIFVDIFPYEKMPNLPYAFVYRLVRWRSGTFRRWRFPLLKQRQSIVAKLADCVKAVIWKTGYLGACVLWRGLCILFPGRGWHMAPESEFPNRANEEQLFPTKEHLFEGLNFPIPNDWEWVLKTEYSNWRELPPEADRVCHTKLIIPEL